ncbi:MAG TPA: hypothetical protein VGN14_13745 [Candidatus Elarobacter sp.]
MMRRVLAAAAFAAAPLAAAAATPAQLDSWLASSPAIVKEKPPYATSAYGTAARYINVKGANATGWVVPAEATEGFLADGRRVMVAPINSGGSGGVFSALLFTQTGTTPHFVGTIPSGGGHLLVSVNAGRLLIEWPIYVGDDPNCCPSALHFEHASVRGNRLVTDDHWDVKLAKSPH